MPIQNTRSWGQLFPCEPIGARETTAVRWWARRIRRINWRRGNDWGWRTGTSL